MPCYKMLCCLMYIVAIGCEAAMGQETGRMANEEGLIPYVGLMQRLFDDEFGGLTLGTPWNNSMAEESLLLSKRAISAGSVLVCAVGTVTEGSIDGRMVATVEFRCPGISLERPCSGILSENLNRFE